MAFLSDLISVFSGAVKIRRDRVGIVLEEIIRNFDYSNSLAYKSSKSLKTNVTCSTSLERLQKTLRLSGQINFPNSFRVIMVQNAILNRFINMA